MNAQSDMLAALHNRLHEHTLPQRFYADPTFYQLDIENLFYREWLFAGHDCEVRQPGDYFTLQIGDYPVIVVRGRDGAIRAFHNTCRHRGSGICAAENGSAAGAAWPHSTPYHAPGRPSSFR